MATDNDQAAEVRTPIWPRILCLTGPESTGKTTLAVTLAKQLGAKLVPEVARGFLQDRGSYSSEDVLAIARHQVTVESETLADSCGLVVCDTDLTVIRVWWEEKYGTLPDILLKLLAERSDRAYLLMKPDVAWVSDSLRENPHDRDRLYLRYLALLEADNHPFRTVSGTGDRRIQSAINAIRVLFPDLTLPSVSQGL